MLVAAIDPGTEQSALVVYDGATKRVTYHVIASNPVILETLLWPSVMTAGVMVLAIEEFVSSFGMAVGKEVFKTVWWAGRFYEAFESCRRSDPGARAIMVPRKTAVTHICGVARANDSNVRAEIIDRFGGKIRAIGKKSTPGPLYGLKGHEFAALAVAITVAEGSHGEETSQA